MADLALGGLGRIFRAALKIKKAVETVQQNKRECRDIQRCAARITALLSWLKELTMGAVMHPAFSGPLDDLADSMEEALELITDCQQRSTVSHLLGAGGMAKKLRRVHDDILRKLAPANFATGILNLQISVSVTNTLHYVGPHPPLLLPEVAGEVNSYDNNLNVIEMRPEVNSNKTMVATGSAVPYAFSSRLAEFNSSKWESALHLSSEENISQGGHAFVLKQKIVIKVAMQCDRCRSKAMVLAARADGVMSMGITGDARDQLVVEGKGVDIACLTMALQRKVGATQLLQVGPAGRFRSNGELPPARLRFSDPSSGSSSDAEAAESLSSSPACPASFKRKGKQTLPVAQPHHQEDVRPHVAAPARPDSPSTGRIMAPLRDAAAGLKASCLSVHEWLVPVVPAYGMIFVFVLFLLLLRNVTSSSNF